MTCGSHFSGELQFDDVYEFWSVECPKEHCNKAGGVARETFFSLFIWAAPSHLWAKLLDIWCLRNESSMCCSGYETIHSFALPQCLASSNTHVLREIWKSFSPFCFIVTYNVPTLPMCAMDQKNSPRYKNSSLHDLLPRSSALRMWYTP